MSIEYNINMDVKLKDIPDNVRLWFKATEQITCVDDYEHVILTVPNIILDTASRMSRLKILTVPKATLDTVNHTISLNSNYDNDEGTFYSYTEHDGYSRLILSTSNSNGDYDIERFIHYILPYVVHDDISDSIILTTCDSEQETWAIDIDETLKLKDVTEVEKVHLPNELQMYTNNIDYETVKFMENVKEYIKNFIVI